MLADPYILRPEDCKEPPTTFRGRLRHLGPSFILSASIVGSGELIATTTLGAKAGFVTFWVIIVSCLVKVAVQMEMGKHTILSGETAMQAFNQLPGPRWGRCRWSIWSVLIILSIKLLQIGGIIGGVAIIMNLVWPAIPIPVAVAIMVIIVASLVYRGYYRSVEKLSLVLIAFFTVFTFTALYFLNYTDYALSWDAIASGLKFDLPTAAVAVAFGAFGITGVGGDEIIHYNYWCLEKGYASHTGPNDQSEAWKSRARGWIKVMQLDALMAMVIYTVVTAAFYLLGASVLHAQDKVPEGYEVIESLSNMYTAALGPNAKPWFLLGSFVVLFSTLFAALAALTRQYSDMLGQLGVLDFLDLKQRKRSIAILAWVLPVVWALMFLFIKLPVLMVIIGGIMGSLLLLIVVFATLHFRYVRTEQAFKPDLIYDVILWLSVAAISLVAIYGLIQLNHP